MTAGGGASLSTSFDGGRPHRQCREQRPPHPVSIASARNGLAPAPQHPRRQQQRRLSSRGGGGGGGRGRADPNAPLLNEHLIARLFKKLKGGAEGDLSADTFLVRLLVDRGHCKGGADDGGADGDLSADGGGSSDGPSAQVCTLNEAITIAHAHALDLMEVNIRQSPPVLKAVDHARFAYDQKKKLAKLNSRKKREGGGAISDRPLKEFKFRAGIADHDLGRKAANMMGYLARGHAIRVTLTARQRSLNMDAAAITTTLERVKELVGDKAVEARGMKANDRKSFGSLVLHPNKGGKA